MFQRGDEGDVWQHRDGGDQTARSDCLDCNSEPMVSRGSGVKEKKETWMTVGSGPAERRSRPSGEGWEVSRPAGKRRRGDGDSARRTCKQGRWEGTGARKGVRGRSSCQR